MTAAGGGGQPQGAVQPVMALVFATVAFAALAIFGLGMTSLATGEDVIAAPGLGQIPGVAGMLLSILAFAGGLWAAIGRTDGRMDASPPAVPSGPGVPRSSPPQVGGADGSGARHPSFWGAAWTAGVSFLAYVGGVWLGAVFSGVDVGVATGVAARIATSWFGAVIALAALVCAWGGIALVRTRAHRPRWPWEDEFDE